MNLIPSAPPVPLGGSTPGIAAPVDAAARVAPDPTLSPNPAVSPDPAVPSEAGGESFSLRFDIDTQRFILEARDPVTGMVTFQTPPKDLLKQIKAAANATAADPRGRHIDSRA